MCNPVDGQCAAQPLPDGLACEDGDPCTTNDACSGGVCTSGLPNVCDPPAPPTADDTPKNRYLSFVAGGTVPDGNPVVQALRVGCVGHPGFLKWVGAPDVNGLSHLQCAPVYRDWGATMVQVGDVDIAPQQVYVVQGIRELADPADETAYSVAANVATVALWGDITAGVNQFDVWLPLEGIVNVGDVQAVVLGFQGQPAPPLTWLDLRDLPPNGVVHSPDIQLDAPALVCAGYPYTPPQPVP